MSVITFPADFDLTLVKWGEKRRDISFESAFAAQTIRGSAPRWAVTIERDDMAESDAGELQSILLQMDGSLNQVAMFNPGRPVPLGTLRGTWTLAAPMAAGATSCTIRAGATQGGGTLKAGDMFGFGSGVTQQLVMLTADAADNSGGRSLVLDFATETYQAGIPGDVTVNFRHAARNAFPAGEPLTWDHPRALFRRVGNETSWSYSDVAVNDISVDLVEDWHA